MNLPKFSNIVTRDIDANIASTDNSTTLIEVALELITTVFLKGLILSDAREFCLWYLNKINLIGTKFRDLMSVKFLDLEFKFILKYLKIFFNTECRFGARSMLSSTFNWEYTSQIVTNYKCIRSNIRYRDLVNFNTTRPRNTLRPTIPRV